jgi:RecA-family ATPase
MMNTSYTLNALHNPSEVNPKQRILDNAKKMSEQDFSADDIENICLGINQNLNEPPLEVSTVQEIVKSIANKAARKKVAADLGFDFSLDQGRINYTESSPARPFLFGRDIIPMNTVSVIGGLGGSGKSMAMVEMIGAVVIGGQYAKRASTEEVCSLYLAFEDSQEELNARFSAVMANYTQAQKDRVAKNARAISLVGQRFQLVTLKGRVAEATGLSDLLIEKLLGLKEDTGLEQAMLVIDHARLVAQIEWNDAAQVTVLTQELHKIAHEAKAAVVLIAHSPKNTAAADHQTSQADIAGSSALVDNARFVGLVRGMNPAEAKTLGIKPEARNNYLKLECIKSNYSATGLIGWFIKTNCPHHHVATHTYVEPCKTIPTKEGDSADESRIIKYVRANPDLTLADLRKRSGKNGVLGMSDLNIHKTAIELIEKGILIYQPPSPSYTKKISPNFKGVLGIANHV